MISPSDNIILPVGLDIDGVRYKKVKIQEMNGFDEENLASRKVRNNGAKAQTILLQRCIQSIEGLVDKKNPFDLLKEEYVTKLTSYDRDYLFYCIRILGDVDAVDFNFECQSCGHEQTESFKFTDLEVYDWPEEEPCEIEFELNNGIMFNGKQHKKGKWKFLTGKQQEQISKLPNEKIVNASIRLCAQFEDLGAPSETQLKTLSTNERGLLLEQIADEAPGVQSGVDICCDACGQTSRQSIDVSRFFRSATGAKITPNGRTTRRRLRRT